MAIEGEVGKFCHAKYGSNIQKNYKPKEISSIKIHFWSRNEPNVLLSKSLGDIKFSLTKTSQTPLTRKGQNHILQDLRDQVIVSFL